MAIELPRSLVEFILLGPEDDRRQLQDSPILGDVWLAFAKNPDARLELLITPYRDTAAGKVATLLAKCLEGKEPGKKSAKSARRAEAAAHAGAAADVAYLQGIVAARLSFAQLLRFVVPMTRWWNDTKIAAAIANYQKSRKTIQDDFKHIVEAESKWRNGEDQTSPIQDTDTHKRYIALAGLVLWAQEQKSEGKRTAATFEPDQLLDGKTQKRIVDLLGEELEALHQPRDPAEQSLVWHVSRNRPASAALTKSIPAVKADSARSLFTVKCKEIVWAIIDSGIDARHPAFLDDERKVLRVQKSFDFTRIREIVSLDNVSPERAKARIASLLAADLQDPPDQATATEQLTQLATDARAGRSINWELVERLIEIKPQVRPHSNHGTHVAGILAANKSGDAQAGKQASEDVADGMCPDIRLYDFRVLSPTLKETEFAIIAALQYIRYINERNSFMTIHGANLSLSIRHDVRNYACGRTPVCNECERLVNSGVVVVAAAGNRGYQGFETKEGLYESYAAFSVTDPGNADGVITVGATHRYWPHTYGVSFFSSRGPTGDGRMKPDLVAPGERIRAPLLDQQWGDLDGTSMAAPAAPHQADPLRQRHGSRTREDFPGARDAGRAAGFPEHLRETR
jgi:subtilisin family serine protease